MKEKGFISISVLIGIIIFTGIIGGVYYFGRQTSSKSLPQNSVTILPTSQPILTSDQKNADSNIINDSGNDRVFSTSLFTFMLPTGYKIKKEGSFYYISSLNSDQAFISIDIDTINSSYDSVVANLKEPPLNINRIIPLNQGIELDTSGPGYVKITYWTNAIFHYKQGAIVVGDLRSVKGGSDLFHKVVDTFKVL